MLFAQYMKKLFTILSFYVVGATATTQYLLKNNKNVEHSDKTSRDLCGNFREVRMKRKARKSTLKD